MPVMLKHSQELFALDHIWFMKRVSAMEIPQAPYALAFPPVAREADIVNSKV